MDHVRAKITCHVQRAARAEQRKAARLHGYVRSLVLKSQLDPRRHLLALLDELDERVNVRGGDQLIALPKVPQVRLERLDEELGVVLRNL